jgi:hypothetical protein
VTIYCALVGGNAVSEVEKRRLEALFGKSSPPKYKRTATRIAKAAKTYRKPETHYAGAHVELGVSAASGFGCSLWRELWLRAEN